MGNGSFVFSSLGWFFLCFNYGFFFVLLVFVYKVACFMLILRFGYHNFLGSGLCLCDLNGA